MVKKIANWCNSDFAPCVHILGACLMMIVGILGDTEASCMLGLAGMFAMAVSYPLLDNFARRRAVGNR